MIFPYQRYAIPPTQTYPDGILYRPEVPIRVAGSSDELTLFALLDSGADETILPRSLATELGTQIDESRRSLAAGFTGGKVEIAYGNVHFEIRDDSVAYRWSASVGFYECLKPESETVILGHAGCLEFMRTTFDGERHEIDLRPTRSTQGIQVWADDR